MSKEYDAMQEAIRNQNNMAKTMDQLFSKMEQSTSRSNQASESMDQYADSINNASEAEKHYNNNSTAQTMEQEAKAAEEARRKTNAYSTEINNLIERQIAYNKKQQKLVTDTFKKLGTTQKITNTYDSDNKLVNSSEAIKKNYKEIENTIINLRKEEDELSSQIYSYSRQKISADNSDLKILKEQRKALSDQEDIYFKILRDTYKDKNSNYTKEQYNAFINHINNKDMVAYSQQRLNKELDLQSERLSEAKKKEKETLSLLEEKTRLAKEYNRLILTGDIAFNDSYKNELNQQINNNKRKIGRNLGLLSDWAESDSSRNAKYDLSDYRKFETEYNKRSAKSKYEIEAQNIRLINKSKEEQLKIDQKILSLQEKKEQLLLRRSNIEEQLTSFEKSTPYGLLKTNNNLRKQYNELKNILGKEDNKFNNTDLSKADQLLSSMKNKLAEIQKTNAFNIDKKVKSAQLDTYIESLKNAGKYSDDIIERAEKLRKTLDRSTTNTGFKEYEGQLKLVENEIQRINNAEKADADAKKKKKNELKNVEQEYNRYLSLLKEARKYEKEYVDTVAKGQDGSSALVGAARAYKKAFAIDTSKFSDDQKFTISAETQRNQSDIIDNINGKYKEQEKVLKRINTLQTENAKNPKNANYDKNVKEIKALRDSVKSFKEEMQRAFGSDAAGLIDKLNAKEQELNGNLKDLSNKFKLDAAKKEAKSFESQLSSLEKQLTKISKNYNGKYASSDMEIARKQADELRDALEKIKADPLTINAQGAKEALQELIDRASKVKEEISKLASLTALSNTAKKMQDAITKNSRFSGNAQSAISTYIRELNSGAEITEARLKEIATSFNKIYQEEIKAGRGGTSFFDLTSKKLRSFTSQMLMYYTSWMDMIRYFRNGVTAVRELDTALIDLRKTTTMTDSELKQFYYDANDVAKNMGVTTKEIISQAAAFSRLGYSSKEAATMMAELSSQFASISPGMDIDNATDGLVSTMQAFGIATEDAERKVMDNINAIGNTMATSNNEIVEMLKRSSAAMDAANNSLEETIALESAAIQITRNAETTGTAFRTKFVHVYSNMYK